MHQIVEAFLFLLLERELILLAEGSTMKDLVNETIAKMKNNTELVQLGSWFGKTLLESKHVEELFATDEELFALINEL